MSQGEIYRKIKYLMKNGSGGDPIAMSYIRSKLMLKGVYPDRYGPETDDPPEIVLVVDRFIYNLIGRELPKDKITPGLLHASLFQNNSTENN